MQQLMTSESSRELVGQMFSTQGAVPKYPQFADWRCNDVNLGMDMSYFYITRLSDGTWGLYFSLLHGKESAFQIVAAIPGISIENLLDLQTPYATSVSVPVGFTGDSFAPKISVAINKTTSGYPTIQFFEETAGGWVSMGPAKAFYCRK
jgi:hypothetical protein